MSVQLLDGFSGAASGVCFPSPSLPVKSFLEFAPLVIPCSELSSLDVNESHRAYGSCHWGYPKHCYVVCFGIAGNVKDNSSHACTIAKKSCFKERCTCSHALHSYVLWRSDVSHTSQSWYAGDYWNVVLVSAWRPLQVTSQDKAAFNAMRETLFFAHYISFHQKFQW